MNFFILIILIFILFLNYEKNDTTNIPIPNYSNRV